MLKYLGKRVFNTIDAFGLFGAGAAAAYGEVGLLFAVMGIALMVSAIVENKAS